MPLLFASEARDGLLARVAFEAIWERDLDSEAMSWDDRVESIFGYDSREVIGHLSWWRERIHPEDLERVERAVAHAIESGASAWSNQYRFRRKDGSWAWVWSRGAIERDGQGRALRALGAMIDISPFKENEARLRLFTDQIPARATATDRDVREKISSGRKYIDPVRIRDIKILPETTKARKPEEQTCQCGSLEIHHSHFEFGALQRLIASYFKIPAITRKISPLRLASLRRKRNRMSCRVANGR